MKIIIVSLLACTLSVSVHADTIILQKNGAIAIACGNPAAVPMASRVKQDAWIGKSQSPNCISKSRRSIAR
jgi:hypothetical protein